MKFLVVVMPTARPGTHVSVGGTSVAPQPQPQVRWVEAHSHYDALGQGAVDVAPGFHALVIDEGDVHRWDRALTAPLEQREPNGALLPREATP